MGYFDLKRGQQSEGISPHAASHRQGETDAISPEAIGAEQQGAAVALLSSLLSGANNETFERLSIRISTPPDSVVWPNSTRDIIISNPVYYQGACLLVVGGYGNSISGNYSGFYLLSGLLYFPFESQEGHIMNIHRIVEQANGGSMSLTALTDGTLRLRLTNSNLMQPKNFRVAQILI